MSQKQMLELTDKLSSLLAGLTKHEQETDWGYLVNEWVESEMVPGESETALLDEISAPTLIEAASGPLGDRLNWNRNNEFQRAMRAKTVQEFSDALR